MEIGLIGLGKMGYALALNMREHGHRVFAFSRSAEKAAAFAADNLEGSSDLESIAGRFQGRRVIWLMVPAGDAVDLMIEQLTPLLDKGDILIDGGNSHYRDSVRRAAGLEKLGINYVDAGISGGPGGARRGACMMIGAKPDIYSYLEPLLKDVCVESGYLRVGENGSGHYVKMIHNGIEYGMLQAIAEGFELMDSSTYQLDYQALAGLWNNGSVIRGWLIELTEKVFSGDPGLDKLNDVTGSSGTGLWTVEEAFARKVPLPVITQSLFARYRSEQDQSFSAKLVAGLRREFGGHDVEET